MIDKFVAWLKNNPKLNPKSQVNQYVNLLRMLFKENNMQVQISAINLMSHLSNGLKSNFASHAKQVIPVLLDKLKEKHKAMSGTLLKVLPQIFQNVKFEDTLDKIKESLQDKNMIKVANVIKVINKLIEEQDKITKGGIAKKTVKTILKQLKSKDKDVRELAAQTVAMLKDKFPKQISPLTNSLSGKMQ